jgi:DNA-binding LytR/AlgR family response regulator
MINCLIVDDEPVARSIIRNYCGRLPFLHIAGECGHALEAKEILSMGNIDLLFLDIHMPILTGIGFLSTLKQPPLVIFTTAYQEYAVIAFDLAACDYLLKPFSLERFIVAIDKARERLQQHDKPAPESFAVEPDSCFIKADGKLYQLYFRDCIYAEAQGNYTKVVTVNTILLTKMPFAEFVALSPGGLFIRVHRSFIINRSMISHIDGNRVFVREKEIPVAGHYKEHFLKAVGIK